MTKNKQQILSAAEIREKRLQMLYKILPIISVLLLIGLWLLASSGDSDFPSPSEVWERTWHCF